MTFLTVQSFAHLLLGATDAAAALARIILGHEPAWAVCMREIDRFLDDRGP